MTPRSNLREAFEEVLAVADVLEESRISLPDTIEDPNGAFRGKSAYSYQASTNLRQALFAFAHLLTEHHRLTSPNSADDASD